MTGQESVIELTSHLDAIDELEFLDRWFRRWLRLAPRTQLGFACSLLRGNRFEARLLLGFPRRDAFGFFGGLCCRTFRSNACSFLRLLLVGDRFGLRFGRLFALALLGRRLRSASRSR